MSERGVGWAAEYASIRTAYCPPWRENPGQGQAGAGVSTHRLFQGKCCISTMRQVVIVSLDRSGNHVPTAWLCGTTLVFQTLHQAPECLLVQATSQRGD